MKDTVFKFFLTFIYFWDRDRVQVGKGQRERETESEAGFRFWAVSTEPGVRLKLTNPEIMAWAKVRCLTDWAPRRPKRYLIYNVYP